MDMKNQGEGPGFFALNKADILTKICKKTINRTKKNKNNISIENRNNSRK